MSGARHSPRDNRCVTFVTTGDGTPFATTINVSSDATTGKVTRLVTVGNERAGTIYFRDVTTRCNRQTRDIRDTSRDILDTTTSINIPDWMTGKDM